MSQQQYALYGNLYYHRGNDNCIYLFVVEFFGYRDVGINKDDYVGVVATPINDNIVTSYKYCNVFSKMTVQKVMHMDIIYVNDGLLQLQALRTNDVMQAKKLLSNEFSDFADFGKWK